MKQVISYICAVVVLVLFSFVPAYAIPPVPEPGTMAILGGLAAGGFIAGKILKRK